MLPESTSEVNYRDDPVFLFYKSILINRFLIENKTFLASFETNQSLVCLLYTQSQNDL